MASENDQDKKKNEELGKQADYLVKQRLEECKDKFNQQYTEFKGKSLKEIPCFRSTFLTSIPSGIFTGLAAYLATSRVKLAANIAMGTYLAVSAGYFTNCRIEFNKKLSQNAELGEIMNLIIKYRGTELEGQLQKKYNEKLQEIDPTSKYVWKI